MPTSPSLSAPAGDALRDYVVAELQLACLALARHGSRVHDGVHDARKAIRRTRAALALGDAALGPGQQVVDRQLQRVNRSLSALRDAHALVETLDRLAAKPRELEVARLLHRARRVAAAQRAAVGRDPAHMAARADANSLCRMLCAAVQGLPWNRVTAALIEDALESTALDCAAAAQRACIPDSRDDDWHRWRRRMRRMSQQRRACAAATHDQGDSLFDKSLAEQLGKLQDLVLLVDHCGRGSPFTKRDRSALRAFADEALSRQRRRIASVIRHAPESVGP